MSREEIEITGLGPRQGAAAPFHRRFLAGVLERNARGIMETKLRALDPEARTLVTREDERFHFGDVELGDAGLRHLVRSFTVDRVRFLREAFPGGVPGRALDLGDTNGIFLRSLEKDGISVNISGPAVRSLRGQGMETVKADVACLPFRDRSIELVLLFETLEHLPDPVTALREIGRVCSGSLILSVPLVSRTAIHEALYDPARPAAQHHVFEFSVPDFRKIVTHTPFGVKREETATVLGGSGRILDRIVIFLWSLFREKDMFCGCFRAFYLCHLARKDAEGGSR